jgi:hypothetical protein
MTSFILFALPMLSHAAAVRFRITRNDPAQARAGKNHWGIALSETPV